MGKRPLLVCTAICAGVAALAGCGGGGGNEVTFHSAAYKQGYACGDGETGASASKLVVAIASCRSLAGDMVTPQSDFDNGVSDGWHVRHGF